MSDKRSTHGLSNTKLYKRWELIIDRTTNKNNPQYKDYGLRGIKVCDEWRDFRKFASWALVNGFSVKLTIDRIDNDGNYEPGNCRFIKLSKQWISRRKREDNTSGYTGIYLDRRWDRFQARITYKYKQKTIGNFDSICDAVNARNRYIDENNLPHKKEEFRK